MPTPGGVPGVPVSRLVLVALIGLLALPGPAAADSLADDPNLPVAQRLDRLELRMTALEQLEADVKKQVDAMDAAIAAGKPLAKALPGKIQQLDLAAGTSTINATTGGGEIHNLGWLCSHAQSLAPQMLALATSMQGKLDVYPPKLAAIPVGADDAAPRLRSLAGEMQSSLGTPLSDETNQQMRVHLKEIDQALPYAWGAYHTLEKIAAEVQSDMEQLRQQVALLAGADRLAYPITSHIHEKEAIGTVLRALQPEYPADVSRSEALSERLVSSNLPGLKKDPVNSLTEGYKYWADQWRPIVDQASAATRRDTHPSRQAFGGGVDPTELREPGPEPEPAPKGCAGMDNPPQKFADARTQARSQMSQAFGRVEQAIEARGSAIDQSLRKAAQVQKTNQDTVATLDQKLQKVKGGGAQAEKARQLRSDAQQGAARMEQAITGLRGEQQALDALKSTLAALSGQVMSYFNPD